jgi:hypothetical protein
MRPSLFVLSCLAFAAAVAANDRPIIGILTLPNDNGPQVCDGLNRCGNLVHGVFLLMSRLGFRLVSRSFLVCPTSQHHM